MPEQEDLLETIFDEYQDMLLEPRIVSSWLGLPGAQLPRETGKIIGQPTHPARKQGASGGYSFEDALLMKLGRTLMELGITPHRVRACIEAVRRDFHYVLTGYFSAPDSDEGFEDTFYLVGFEYPSGFKAVITTEDKLPLFLTASGIAQFEWSEAVRATMLKQLEAVKSNLPKSDLSMIRAGRPEDYTSPSEPLGDPVKDRPVKEEDLDKLADEGYGYIDRRDPGLPAIVQNVTRYLQDQSLQLYGYIQRTEAKKTS